MPPASDDAGGESVISEMNSGRLTVDAMGTIGALSGQIDWSSSRSADYFGPASTFSFVDRAHRATSRRPLSQRVAGAAKIESMPAVGVAPLSPDSMPLSQGSVLEDRRLSEMALPPRAEADQLVESYWTWTHSLYPFIHRTSFEERYAAIWAPAPSSSRRGRSASCAPRSGGYMAL